MDSIIVKGGKPLKGEIAISGAKNAALPLMAAGLLIEGKIILENVPKLTDIYTMQELLKNHGAKIETAEVNNSLTLSIDCSNISNINAPYDIVRKMRASIWVLGPLLARFGKAEVSLPGGCAIGARQVDLHLAVLEAMSAELEIRQGYIHATVKDKLKAVHFSFDRVSVGATITGIMAASLAEGETSLFNCAREPEIIDLCKCLTSMNVNIEGIGTSELKIQGVKNIFGGKYKVMPDRIEAGTYMIAAAITKGEITIKDISFEIIENLALKLIEAGIEVTHNENITKVKYIDSINSVDVQTLSYPGFATDLQAQFMSLMTLGNSSSIITENIFENRFMHVPELCRMGADITINGRVAIIRGVEFLSGAEVMASDLRASVSLILAGLSAKGETKIRRIYHLDRGYQNLVEKLVSCGADIRRVSGDSV